MARVISGLFPFNELLKCPDLLSSRLRVRLAHQPALEVNRQVLHGSYVNCLLAEMTVLSKKLTEAWKLMLNWWLPGTVVRGEQKSKLPFYLLLAPPSQTILHLLN